eukprot:TRINITY_DN8748_c0_g1_i2.p1 TRINITY_DN8748_c0_g1~~TRINITY_DN8748_c0_g1_i2.p1  ORF type:complete len:120 (-),score=41.79 TRINITY_DN8748_c0_g1_i2:243-602(-)
MVLFSMYFLYIDYENIIVFSCIAFFFFFKQKTAYEMLRSLVGSEMCIRDRMSKKFRPRSFDEFANKAEEWLRRLRDGEVAIAAVTDALEDDIWRVTGALKRLNAPKAAPIVIDGVKMDF